MTLYPVIVASSPTPGIVTVDFMADDAGRTALEAFIEGKRGVWRSVRPWAVPYIAINCAIGEPAAQAFYTAVRDHIENDGAKEIPILDWLRLVGVDPGRD